VPRQRHVPCNGGRRRTGYARECAPGRRAPERRDMGVDEVGGAHAPRHIQTLQRGWCRRGRRRRHGNHAQRARGRWWGPSSIASRWPHRGRSRRPAPRSPSPSRRADRAPARMRIASGRRAEVAHDGTAASSGGERAAAGAGGVVWARARAACGARPRAGWWWWWCVSGGTAGVGGGAHVPKARWSPRGGSARRVAPLSSRQRRGASRR
jgi:hypothetical protein